MSLVLPTGLAQLPWKWIGVGFAALVIAIAVPVFIDRAFDETEEKGRLEERSDRLEDTIKNVEKANEAREDINADGPAGDRVRYDQCLRTARTPANCERWLPSVQAPDR